ncbi:MAG: hypothetical protein HN904_21565 [Victivallales bacterium]|jgi:hypothetical protein|nr:hypothetical protein [Victivallales bacterium]MBT7165383.1 hypothetical protein [Victivallales bacterium]
MRTLSLIVLAALTWGVVATADVTLMNNFGGSPHDLYPPYGFTDFGSAPSGTPSAISVDPSGWTGAVTGLSVSLLGLTHPYPMDLEVWVANPGGEQSWLMGDAGGIYSVSGIDLTFQDGLFPPAPVSSPLVTAIHHPSPPIPSGFDPGVLDAPGSPLLGEFFLTDLIDPGSNITGNWLLFVFSDDSGEQPDGELGAWTLTFSGVGGGGGGGEGGGPGSNPSTPEPSALLLSLAALAGLAVRRPRRR